MAEVLESDASFYCAPRNQSARQLVTFLLQLCFALGLAMLSPRVVLASENSDAANTAVDIFVAAGNLAGLPITAEEAKIAKGLVTCAVSGSSGVDCAKNVVISIALGQLGSQSPEVAAAAKCLVDGRSVSGCISQAVIGQLPKETQTLATCVIGGGNIADCTKNAALAQILPQVTAALPPEAKETINCVVGGSSVATCAENLVKKEVNEALKAAGTPPEVVATVNGMVNCVSSGKNAADCAKSTVTQNLPADVKGLASCLSGGAAAQTCLADFAASKIPDANASGAVKCMGQPGDQAQKCLASLSTKALGGAAQQAQQEAVKQALATIAKLNVTAEATNPRGFPQQPAVLKNFILVADGIKDGDWSKIVIGGGAQVASIASRIILSIFLTPALANVLGPVADMMIQNDVAAFQESWSAARRGDPVGVAEAAAKWYATTYIIPTCGVIPNGAFRDAACGAVADAINWVAGTAGGLTKGILGIGKDILDALGLWNPIDNVATVVWKDVTSVVDKIGHFLGLGDEDAAKVVYLCTTQPKDYFANNVLSSCLGSATASAIAGGAANTSGVTAACAAHYGQCSSDKTTVQNNCQKMSDALGVAAGKAGDTIKAAASTFSTTGAAGFASQIYKENAKAGFNSGPRDMCSPTFWSDMALQYGDYCAGKIGKNFPESFSNSTANSCSIPTSRGAVQQACMSALLANTDKSAWAGGPNSAFCKEQKRVDEIAAALNPCVITGTTQVDGSGKTFNLPNIKCAPSNAGEVTSRVPFMPGMPGRDIWIDFAVLKNPTLPISVSLGNPDIRFPTGSKIPVPGILPGSNRVKLPSVSRLPTGSGGLAISRQPSDASPRIDRIPARPVITNNRVGSGGSNTARGGNSAMDRLGNINTGAGLSGVAGNAGGAAIMRPPMRPPVASAPSGTGSGGSNRVNAASGNSPTKSGASGTLPTRPIKPVVPDSNFNYGRCAECENRKDPLVVR